MITPWFAVFWTPWWDVDHHNYGCPLGVTVHTRRHVLSVRPFSDYAQGGDRRGETPWQREEVRRWVLHDQIAWDVVQRGRRFHWTSRCVICLHDEETCTELRFGHDCRPARLAVFPRHLLQEHLVKRACHGYRESDWVTVEDDE